MLLLAPGFLYLGAFFDLVLSLLNETLYTVSMPDASHGNYLEIGTLQQKLATAKLPPDLLEKANLMITRAQTAIQFGGYFSGIDQTNSYVDVITNYPWFNRSPDTIDIAKASEILDKNHFGLKEIKERILEYISVLKLSKAYTAEAMKSNEPTLHAPVLLLMGLAGTGKTTLAYSMAEALGREIIRIPFGGLGSAKELRGQSRAFPDAEPSLLVKGILRAKTKNPLILLDEIDRVTNDARAEIMGVLIELLDPIQNGAFAEHYIDYPLDLSEVLFIATSNKAEFIAQAVLDRFEQITMPLYNDVEKNVIAKTYLLPKIIKASGLTPDQVIILEATWPHIIRPAGYDAGMRTLERTITSICRKIALYTVEGKGSTYTITPENLKSFLHTDINIY